MRLVGLALAGVLLTAPAFAQYVPRPPAPIGPMPADDVAEIVQAMGLDPVGYPGRSGPFYVQHALDGYGRTLRVTVDARRSQVLAVEAAGTSRAPYRAYAGYPYRRPYARHARSDFDLAPPGSVMGPRAQPHDLPPPSAAAPRAAGKSAAIAPQRPPLPRKRPASVPEQASAGSVEPVAPAPQAAPAPEKPEPPKPAAPALTPVAPLE
jgi:hypothetical protein